MIISILKNEFVDPSEKFMDHRLGNTGIELKTYLNITHYQFYIEYAEKNLSKIVMSYTLVFTEIPYPV